MKKIIASASLLAMGSVGLYAQQYGRPALTREETTKPWSISASLRGFYDDNYLAAHKTLQDESFGFEFSPAAGFRFNPTDQTRIRLDYIYSLIYYEGRPDDHFDHSHEFRGRADHQFNERTALSLEDSFVYAQQPIIVDEGAAGTFKVEGDALRNRAAINGTFQLTELFGIGAGYQNLWVDWKQDGDFSRSALLDRFEHLFRVDGRWQLQRDLVGLVGYNLGIADYTSDRLIDGAGHIGDDRDSVSHYAYVGAEKAFTDVLKGAARVGLRYTDYHKFGETTLQPYADLSATYEYLRGSYAQLGLKYDRNATDVAGALEQNTVSLAGSLAHRITPRLSAKLLAQVNRSEFEQGFVDGELEYYLLAGASLEYAITPNWSTEAGYNYDRLDSDLALRSFTRNRVYLGVRAHY